MSGTPRLVRREGVYYFRMAIPERWVQKLQRREIKTTLRTTERKRATLLCRTLSNRLDILFNDEAFMTNSPLPMLNEHIRGIFQEMLNEGQVYVQTWSGDQTYDVEQALQGFAVLMETYKEDIRTKSYSKEVLQQAAKIAQLVPADLVTVSKQDAIDYLCQGIYRAHIENWRIRSAKFRAEFEDIAPRDPLFRDMDVTDFPPPDFMLKPQQEQPKSKTLAQTAAEYRQASIKKGLKEKTLGDFDLTMDWVYSVVNANKPISLVSKDDVRAFRDLLSELPANFEKHPKTKGKTAADAAKVGVDMPKISARTQRKRLAAFTGLLRWAVSEGFVQVFVGEGISINAKPVSKDPRQPFSEEQLQKIFEHPIYRGRKSESQFNVTGKLFVKDHLFWVPLIALFSGMRAGEILQLTKSDIKTEGGIALFDINKWEGEGKTLKTESSMRKVPIHKTLIELGFLTFANAQSEGRLFPRAKLGSDGTYSQYYSKQWRTIANKAGVYTKKSVFHSFRHSFIDACRNAKIPDTLGKQMVGHKDTDTHSGYGSGAVISTLKSEIDRISYFGLELKHLNGAEWKF